MRPPRRGRSSAGPPPSAPAGRPPPGRRRGADGRAGWTTWTGPSAPSRKLVRSTSWRSTISCKARRRQSASSSPSSRTSIVIVAGATVRASSCRARPETLLREGERGRRAAVLPEGGDRRPLRRRRAGAGARSRRRGRRGRRLEEAPQGQLDAEAPAAGARPPGRPAANGRRARRSCPRAPTRSSPSTSAPDPGERAPRPGCAGRAARAPAAASLRREPRQGPAVELAVGGQRQRVQADEGRRAPCRPAARSPGPRSDRVPRPLPVGHDVGHQAAAARQVRARAAHRLPHAGHGAPAPPRSRPARCGSPQLDLLVERPSERHLAVGPVAAEVAGAVEPVPGSPVNGLAWNRSAVSSSLPR